MGWKAMENLRELLCKELDEYKTKDKLGMSDLEIVNKITDTIKNIDKIEMLEDEGGGYSKSDGMRYARDAEWDARGTYARGNSYARRGEHYVRGHYSRDDDDYSQRRMYSRDDAKMEIIGQIEDMMHDASGRMRDILKNAKTEIERA